MSVIESLVRGIDATLVRVLGAVGPIFVLLLITQYTMLRLSPREFGTFLRGFVLAGLGLLLFLQGVEVAFIPIGEELGREIAIRWSPWWLVPIGFALGFLTTFAEPAVQLLSDQVYEDLGRRDPPKLDPMDPRHRRRLFGGACHQPHDFRDPYLDAPGACTPLGAHNDPLF